jgi:hypothetical protein
VDITTEIDTTEATTIATRTIAGTAETENTPIAVAAAAAGVIEARRGVPPIDLEAPAPRT